MSLLIALFDFIAVLYNYLTNPSDSLVVLKRWFGNLVNFRFTNQTRMIGPQVVVVEERLTGEKDIYSHFLFNAIEQRIQRLGHNDLKFSLNAVWFHHVIHNIPFNTQMPDRKYAKSFLDKNRSLMRRFAQRCYVVLTAIAGAEGRQVNFYYFEFAKRGIYDCVAGYACCAVYRGITTAVHFADKLKDAESLCCLQILDVFRAQGKTHWLDIDFPDVDIAPDRVYICYPSPYDSDDSD